MADVAPLDAVNRFTGLADFYARSRPGYPTVVLDYVLTRCGLKPGAALIDVGCGTGIASRQFAARGLRVLGVEPNAEMRARAEAEPTPTGALELAYRAGRAEATELPDAVGDAVLAAQAFHWFEAEPALSEFHRILRPGSWAILLWNEGDASDPFTAAYQAVVSSLEARHARSGAALLASSLFQDGERALFSNEQELDKEGLIGRALSVSYAPRDPARVKQFLADLEALFERFQKGGRVRLLYATIVYTASRRETSSAETGKLVGVPLG